MKPHCARFISTLMALIWTRPLAIFLSQKRISLDNLITINSSCHHSSPRSCWQLTSKMMQNIYSSTDVQQKRPKELMQLLESETSRLEAFLEWKQLEPVYWQWMETVLDTMAEDVNTCNAQDICSKKTTLANASLCYCSADNIVEEIDQLTKDLVILGDGLRDVVTCKKSEWHEKIKARERELLDEKEFSEAIRKIHEAVELKLSEFKYQCAHKKNKMHGPCRLVFKDKHPASKMSFSRSRAKEALMNVSASELVNELRMREGRLEKELKQLQEECRHKLTEIVDGLDGVICIPPMKR
uniref:Tubulin epsilon and delta complex 1 n=1 Tax=Crocodylus porosus TaxID=8502 RepID=A0A7M4DYG6_CROPO